MKLKKIKMETCFNPCFNGTYSLTTTTEGSGDKLTSFNPCFNGTYSLTTKLNISITLI